MYEYLNTLSYLRISVFWGRHLHSDIIPKGAGIRSFSSVIGLSHNLSFHTFYAIALHLPLIRLSVEYCNIFTTLELCINQTDQQDYRVDYRIYDE